MSKIIRDKTKRGSTELIQFYISQNFAILEPFLHHGVVYISDHGGARSLLRQASDCLQPFLTLCSEQRIWAVRREMIDIWSSTRQLLGFELESSRTDYLSIPTYFVGNHGNFFLLDSAALPEVGSFVRLS